MGNPWELEVGALIPAEASFSGHRETQPKAQSIEQQTDMISG
jgi:hypothetical protein